MRHRVSTSGSCGLAQVSDELADTTSELDDFSFSVDVKLNLVSYPFKRVRRSGAGINWLLNDLCYCDLVYAAASEIEFAVQAGDHIADHAATRGDGEELRSSASSD